MSANLLARAMWCKGPTDCWLSELIRLMAAGPGGFPTLGEKKKEGDEEKVDGRGKW